MPTAGAKGKRVIFSLNYADSNSAQLLECSVKICQCKTRKAGNRYLSSLVEKFAYNRLHTFTGMKHVLI